MSGKCTENTLSKAKENIKEKFALVAPTEDVDIVSAIIAAHYGMQNIAKGMAQVTKFKLVSRENIELCEKIKQKDKYDFQLYEFIKEHWNSWKEQQIESILENRNNNSLYLTITPSFYQTRELKYMNLSQIESFSESEIDLVGLTQTYF